MRLTTNNLRRAALAAAVVVLHVALLVLLLARRPPPVAAPEAVLVIHAVTAPATPRRRDPAIAVDLAAVAVEIDRPALHPTAPCAVAESVGAALGADAATVAALTPLAATAAPAIMVWDGAWSLDPAVLPVRRVVARLVAAAPPSCRDEILTGPRLLFVSVATNTVSVAIGSGRWSWSELLSKDVENNLTN